MVHLKGVLSTVGTPRKDGAVHPLIGDVHMMQLFCIQIKAHLSWIMASQGPQFPISKIMLTQRFRLLVLSFLFPKFRSVAVPLSWLSYAKSKFSLIQFQLTCSIPTARDKSKKLGSSSILDHH